MPRWIAVGIGMFCALLALFSIVQSHRIDGLEGEVEQLHRTVRQLERQKNVVEAPDVPTRSDLDDLREEVAQVKEIIDEGTVPLRPRTPGEPLPTLINEEDIEQIVDARVEKKLKEQGRQGGGGERKMPIDELAKELELDPATQERVSEVANSAKSEIFEMIKIPRPDGGSFADDFRDAIQSGEPGRMQQVFMKLFSENIPGTEVRYVEGIGEIRTRAHESLRGAMGEVIYQKYSGMKIHPDHIQTSYDPIAEYLQQK